MMFQVKIDIFQCSHITEKNTATEPKPFPFSSYINYMKSKHTKMVKVSEKKLFE